MDLSVTYLPDGSADWAPLIIWLLWLHGWNIQLGKLIVLLVYTECPEKKRSKCFW